VVIDAEVTSSVKLAFISSSGRPERFTLLEEFREVAIARDVVLLSLIELVSQVSYISLASSE
jgi:hypothetical protein